VVYRTHSRVARRSASTSRKLTDRQQDGAEPLLAIADAGRKWLAAGPPTVANCALFAAQAADTSIGVQLLTDIRQIFDAREVDRLASVDLAAALGEIETSPWVEWSHEKPITRGSSRGCFPPMRSNRTAFALGTKLLRAINGGTSKMHGPGICGPRRFLLLVPW